MFSGGEAMNSFSLSNCFTLHLKNKGGTGGGIAEQKQ
jgi:hypothetical protein